MTAPVYPQYFKQLWNDNGIKAAFVSEVKPLQPSDCGNCGGSGKMITFVARGGPFNTPGGKGISHFANGKWWQGENFTALCPVCQGEGKH